MLRRGLVRVVVPPACKSLATTLLSAPACSLDVHRGATPSSRSMLSLKLKMTYATGLKGLSEPDARSSSRSGTAAASSPGKEATKAAWLVRAASRLAP